MSNKDTITCWACDSVEESSLKDCSNCGMPLSQADSSKDELDDFLDEFSPGEKSTPDLPDMDESPSIPELPDSPELPSFDASPALPEIDESPSIPDFPDSPELPSFDASPTLPEIETTSSDEQIESPSIPDFNTGISEVSDDLIDGLESPELPSFDDFGLDLEETVEDEVEKAGVLVPHRHGHAEFVDSLHQDDVECHRLWRHVDQPFERPACHRVDAFEHPGVRSLECGDG